jgi:hypothetical protein
MDALLAGGYLEGSEDGGQATCRRGHPFVAHRFEVAKETAIGRHLGLAAEALGDVGCGPGVHSLFACGDLRDGLGRAATFAGAQTHDVS